MSNTDCNLRLERASKTRAILAKLMDDNQFDAIVYPLQKRLIMSVGETDRAKRNGILASVTCFPQVTMAAGI